jgi:hypothetical protein
MMMWVGVAFTIVFLIAAVLYAVGSTSGDDAARKYADEVKRMKDRKEQEWKERRGQ